MSEIHICRGVNREYIARIRKPHHKSAMCLGKPHKTAAAAIRKLVNHMLKYPGDGSLGDVIFTSDYYEPTLVFELKIV